MANIPTIGESDTVALTEEQQAALAEMADRAGVTGDETLKSEPAPNAQTAFLVVIDLEGQVTATHDLSEAGNLRLLRPSGPDDMFGAASTVIRDLTIQQTAMTTVGHMMQVTQAMSQRQQAADLASRVAPNIRG